MFGAVLLLIFVMVSLSLFSLFCSSGYLVVNSRDPKVILLDLILVPVKFDIFLKGCCGHYIVCGLGCSDDSLPTPCLQ